MLPVTLFDERWQKMLPVLRAHPNAYVGQEKECRRFLSTVLWMARSAAQSRFAAQRVRLLKHCLSAICALERAGPLSMSCNKNWLKTLTCNTCTVIRPSIELIQCAAPALKKCSFRKRKPSSEVPSAFSTVNSIFGEYFR